MLPTCGEGQLAVVNKLAYRYAMPRRGDIVCVWTGEELLIKRIVGLPGEKLALRNGAFEVDGRPLSEPYVQFNGHWTVGAGEIGRGRYVVVGDNRSMPQKDQLMAVVNSDRILGRLLFFGGARQSGAAPDSL
jgi:signal peptidase I